MTSATSTARARGLDSRARAIGLTLALGGLMVVVDTTVTAVAVPAIVSGLHAPLPAAQWVTTGYLLGLVAVIPLAGWASARFGARRVYLTALLTFTVFSALAGSAWDVTSLAAFRFLQGLGGGLLNPVGQAIGLRAAPREARGRLMSLLVLPLVVGPVLGPPLAGWLIDTASWRWIFLINIPLGLLALLVCALILPRDTPAAVPSPAPARPPTSARRHPARSARGRGRAGAEAPSAVDGSGMRGPIPKVDWAGLVLLSGGAALVVLGGTLLDRPLGPAGAGFAGGLALIAAGALLLGVFARRARRTAWPLVDLRLLRRRPFRAGLGVLNCFGAAYFGTMAVLPLYVQGVRGDPAALLGTLLLPQAITVGLVAQIATRLVDRIPPRRIVLTGAALGAAGGAGLAVATMTGAGYPWIVAASVLLSAGSGATLMPTMTIVLRDLDHDETPRGTTLLALAQQLSTAIGGAVVAVTLSVLVRARTDAGGVATMLALDPAARDALRPTLAPAVGAAYLLPALLLALSWLIAFRYLRPDPATTLVPTPEGNGRN